MWCTADRSGDGDASGMSDPEMCISGGAGSGWSGSLADKEVRIGRDCVTGVRKRICKIKTDL